MSLPFSWAEWGQLGAVELAQHVRKGDVTAAELAAQAHAAAQATELGSFVGNWSDSENAQSKMITREDDGLLRITGGDAAYGYNLACLVKDKTAICTGDGGKLEGKNFLYHSLIEFKANGVAIESWKAFNNGQEIKGTTNWKRN